MTEYSEDEMLMLSGIQHFTFCRRQWALIDIFQQWGENVLTVEGSFMHRNAHDMFKRGMRDGVMEMRGVNVASKTLGLYGVCDIVELLPDYNGTKFDGLEGMWTMRPVEYKHGSVKSDLSDLAQVCAQAICLEETNGIRIETAHIYYGKMRRRHEVAITEELRAQTGLLATQMHDAFKNKDPGSAEYSKKCNACSLRDICEPEAEIKNGGVAKYLERLNEQ